MKQHEQSAAMLQHSLQNQNQDEVLENTGKELKLEIQIVGED